MKSASSPLLTLTLACLIGSTELLRADWPQWRGPSRNGIAAPGADLPDLLTEEMPLKKLWESEAIPSDHDGGHGSVAVAGGKVYVSVVWHRDEPTEIRRIDGRALSNLDYRGTEALGAEIVAKMEQERENLSRRLRGAALDTWAEEWVKTHVDEKTQLSLGGWIIGRFKQGKAAVPIAVYAKLREGGDKEFASQAEMEAWVNAQGFDPEIAKKIIDAVPTTKKLANDVVLCFDAETGQTAWRFEVPGFPSGRGSSSTPAVAGGRVFAALSEHLYAIDASTGKEVWRAPLVKKGPASSPLVAGDKVYLQQNALTAYDVATGKELWQNKDANGSNPSPALWNDGERPVILCNGSKAFIGVDGVTGATLWTTDGGGDSTPSVSGDIAVVVSSAEKNNLVAYRLKPQGSGPEKLWSRDFLARRYGASPIVHEGHVYHLGSDRHLCVSLATGDIAWERQSSSSISSPLLADGKLFVYENRGGFLAMIGTDPTDYHTLGRSKVGALYCASPAIVGKRLYFRTATNVAAYEFP
ncbi:MAG: PQQ-like beta-propeller repeat protein [Verrucomicrobiales bacterium]|nr:PQQ-like beta-propeller repeat protein [Verrucomicrobiales bacterium]